MRATASAAFAGQGERPSPAPQKDRQLQLVPGAEGGSPEPPADEGTIPDSPVPTSTCVVESLAQYALGLRAGDRCFCCGGPLAASDLAGEEGCARSLECPQCGVWVVGPG
jgi:hypothetical protein